MRLALGRPRHDAGTGTGGSSAWLSAAEWVAAGVLSILVVALSAVCVAADPAAWPFAIRLITSAAITIVAVRAAVITRSAPIHLLAAGSAIWLVGDIAEVLVHHLDQWSGVVPMVAQYGHFSARALLALSALWAMGSLLGFATLRRITDTTLSFLVAAFAVVTLSGVTAAGHYAFAVTGVDAIYLTVAGLALCGAAGWLRTPYWVLLISAVVLTMTDVIDLYNGYLSVTAPTWVTQLGWALQSVIRLVATAMIARRFGTAGDTVDATYRESRPMLLAVLTVVGAASVIEPIRHWSWLSILLGLGICAAVVARELMITAEQRDLARSEARAAAALGRRADYDDLTGVYRRESIQRRLAGAMESARRFGSGVAVLSVDLDRFKEINDTFGHETGDRVLRGLAENLQRAASGADVGRWGGDEFVVVHSPVTSSAEVERLLRNVQAAVDAEIHVAPGGSIKPSGSVGVAVVDDWSTPENSPEVLGPGQLIARADRRANEKKRGSARARQAVDGLSIGELDPELMGSALRALDQHRLVVWYQPIVDLRDDRVIGAEALIRMVELDGTVRSAGEFLPMLVAAGHGDHITEFVVRRAFEEFAGGPAAEMGWLLSVNLSERDLAGDRALSVIRTEMQRTGLPGHRLIVEIDEQIAPNDPLGDTVEGLRALGAAVALDDFGARSSSFGQIAHLRPTYLKLDAALAPCSSGDPARTEWSMPGVELADAFTRLAHQLDIRVIAEGIETAEQLEAIRGISCDYGQGFHWSGAVPLDQLISLADGISQEGNETVPIGRNAPANESGQLRTSGGGTAEMLPLR